MRKLLNTEIADYVYEEMKKKNKQYDINYNRILQMVDDSITYNDEFEKDDEGQIAEKLTEEKILDLKNRILEGIEIYFDEIYTEM